MQFVYVKDLVRAALRAMDEPAAVGHAFNIANARPVAAGRKSWKRWPKPASKPVKFVRIPREYILRAGGHPMGPKLYFGVYLDMPPITQVTAKAQRVLKFKPTDFADGPEGNLPLVSAPQRIPQARFVLRRFAAGDGSDAASGEGVVRAGRAREMSDSTVPVSKDDHLPHGMAN